MASSVTMLFSNASWSSSSGMAVISLDASWTRRWPSTRPCSLAQALTRCKGDRSRPRSNERRSVLPSMAITSRSKPSTSEPTQAAPALEGIGIDEHEHTPEGIVRGNAVGQVQEGAQPPQLAAAVERDVVPALSTGDPGADRNHQNVDQVVLDFALAARILNTTEMPNQAFDGHDPLLAAERTRHHSSGSGQRQKFHAFALHLERLSRDRHYRRAL